ncbi:gliding motility-associated C-terminal domain-containing protein [Telluribacter sp. SYSU D00476]|uniref:gliding motility-associated C-terminal domain-containing protein n=1 Tax=Telluribacter sp. SYSU D00476 TaxID=2811430 RepID=UPI001FF4979A|nr:gliding motility-associated C-terminal domain-containing protein [Telluribacter sp. SYSU D00476]
MVIFIFLTSLQLGASYGYAQCPSTIPDLFTYGTGTTAVIDIEECLPRKIKARPTLEGVTNVRTIFDYQGGPLRPENLKTDSIHTYTRPGTYTLVQLSEKEGVKLIGCAKVVVNDTLSPKVRLSACTDGTVQVLFDANQPSQYYAYWVDWGDGTISEVPGSHKTTSHRYSNNRSYTIAAWGVQRLGMCKGSMAFLQYSPSQPIAPPLIKELSTASSTQAELVIENPLATEVTVMLERPDGTFASTGVKTRREKDQVKVSVTNALESTCFRLEASDACLAGTYQSEVVCTAVLDLTEQPEHTQLSWQTRQAATNQRMELMKDGALWKEVTSAGATRTVDDTDLSCGKEHCYQLRIVSSTSIITSSIRCRRTPTSFCSTSTLYIPEAFSPNNDGVNDYFEIKGELPADFHLSVYNQWGTIIYHSTNPANSWDGKSQDTPLPPGQYPYVIRIRDAKGNDYRRTGTVLIIK